MSDDLVLVPGALLLCDTADGLDVQDVLDNMTGADWHSGSYVPQTAAEHRNQVIQELIEAAKADFLDAQKRREEMSGTSLSLRVDRAKATYEWLKSQMEGE